MSRRGHGPRFSNMIVSRRGPQPWERTEGGETTLPRCAKCGGRMVGRDRGRRQHRVCPQYRS